MAMKQYLVPEKNEQAHVDIKNFLKDNVVLRVVNDRRLIVAGPIPEGLHPEIEQLGGRTFPDSQMSTMAYLS